MYGCIQPYSVSVCLCGLQSMQAKERENPSSWTELQQTKRLTDDSTNMASAHTSKIESPGDVNFSRFSSIPEDFEASNMPPPPENMADIPWVTQFCRL